MFCSGISDIGMKRSANQDSFRIKEYKCGAVLGVVCDGMGGAAGGQIASAAAAKIFTSGVDLLMEGLEAGERMPDEYRVAEALLEGVYNANSEIFSRAKKDAALEGMGTTLVASLIMENKIYTVNVGDSRMYLADRDRIVQITHDHSYVQYLVDIGKMTEAQARESLNKNIITRAVGTEAQIDPDIYLTEISRIGNEREKIHIVLCTDGLTNHVPPEKIYEVIQKTSGSSGDTTGIIAKELVDFANKNGGNDNITAVVIAV